MAKTKLKDKKVMAKRKRDRKKAELVKLLINDPAQAVAKIVTSRAFAKVAEAACSKL